MVGKKPPQEQDKEEPFLCRDWQPKVRSENEQCQGAKKVALGWRVRLDYKKVFHSSRYGLRSSKSARRWRAHLPSSFSYCEDSRARFCHLTASS